MPVDVVKRPEERGKDLSLERFGSLDGRTTRVHDSEGGTLWPLCPSWPADLCKCNVSEPAVHRSCWQSVI